MEAVNYLDTVEKLFHYYKSMAEKAIHQIDDHQFHQKIHPEDNSVAIILQHMIGNMRSRFTDFFTSDGEKSWRDRESEFLDPALGKSQLLHEWESAWITVFTAIDQARGHPLDAIVYIRNEGHTVLEAFQRQLAHYAYHTGQIVFLSKSLAGSHWKSLSIPKGQSDSFNAEKFSKDKSKSFFTDKM
ncbi:MAG: DUF1572 family protein [Saprospiraceae bacterium]|nr:DUF1572 family protein [Saprospiraceae bacterium]MCB9318765.1 DUF1572 family protein [Lewinellaceae bacterium]